MGQKPNPRELLRYGTVGIEFIVAFGLGLAAGVWVDRRSGGGTVWPLVGAAVGFAAGMYRMIQVARQYRRDVERKDRQ